MRNKDKTNTEHFAKLQSLKSTFRKFRSAHKNGHIKKIPPEIYELAKEVHREGVSISTIHQITGLSRSNMYAGFKRIEKANGKMKGFRELRIKPEGLSIAGQSSAVSASIEISGFKISIPVEAIGSVVGQLRGAGLC